MSTCNCETGCSVCRESLRGHPAASVAAVTDSVKPTRDLVAVLDYLEEHDASQGNEAQWAALRAGVLAGLADTERPAVVIEWDIRNPLPEKQIVDLLSRFAHHLPPSFKQWEQGQPSDVEYPIVEITVRTRSGRAAPSEETR